MFKKIVSMVVTLALLTPTFSWTYDLNVSSTTTGNYTPTNYKVCQVPTVQEFAPTGDTQGKSVLTKREYVRDCEVTITEQGKCVKWEDKNEKYSLTLDDYNTYETENYTDALGTLLSTLGAYDQINHIWSGWKGFCHIGTISDFSWAKDPMFWASLAISFIMSASAEGGLLDGTKTGNLVNSTAETVGSVTRTAQNAVTSTFKEYTGSAGEMFSNALTKIGDGIQAVKDWAASINPFSDAAGAATSGAADLTKGVVEEGTKHLVQLSTQALGRCMMTEMINMAMATYQFAQDDTNDASGLECDPVDEICDAQNGPNATNGGAGQEILTADETAFNNAVETYTKAQEQEDPANRKNFYDYVEVIKIENGIVSYRFKMNGEVPGYDPAKSQQEMERFKQKVKEMQLAISIGMSAASMLGCITGVTGHGHNANSVSTPTKSDDNRADARKYGGMIIDKLANFLGPWGPVVALAAKLILQVATSFTKVDTCHNEEDAQEAGRRHEQTQKALTFNLCHKIKKKCIDSNFLASLFKGGGSCTLWGYWYCCYDQILTKTLVTQLKAQLGRDYAHCTAITLRDLNYVSLRQCTKSEMADGIDGSRDFEDPGEINPKDSFQYKHKCVDMGEFISYLQSTIGTDVSTDDFTNYWNDLTTQGTEAGLINNGVN